MRQRHSTIRTNPIIKEEPLLINKTISNSQNHPKLKKLLWVLLSPVILGLATFLLGIIFMATGSATTSSVVMTMAITSLVITTAAYIYCPSYFAALMVYVILVKKFNKDKYKSLWIIPAIQTLFGWFPSFFKVPPESRSFASFFGLTASALVLSSIWIGSIYAYYKWQTKRKPNGTHQS